MVLEQKTNAGGLYEVECFLPEVVVGVVAVAAVVVLRGAEVEKFCREFSRRQPLHRLDPCFNEGKDLLYGRCGAIHTRFSAEDNVWIFFVTIFKFGYDRHLFPSRPEPWLSLSLGSSDSLRRREEKVAWSSDLPQPNGKGTNSTKRAIR
jgi:hypothetical protein